MTDGVDPDGGPDIVIDDAGDGGRTAAETPPTSGPSGPDELGIYFDSAVGHYKLDKRGRRFPVDEIGTRIFRFTGGRVTSRPEGVSGALWSQTTAKGRSTVLEHSPVDVREQEEDVPMVEIVRKSPDDSLSGRTAAETTVDEGGGRTAAADSTGVGGDAEAGGDGVTDAGGGRTAAGEHDDSSGRRTAPAAPRERGEI